MTQCNTAHASLDYDVEADDDVPQIPREKAAASGWRLWYPSRGTEELFAQPA